LAVFVPAERFSSLPHALCFDGENVRHIQATEIDHATVNCSSLTVFRINQCVIIHSLHKEYKMNA